MTEYYQCKTCGGTFSIGDYSINGDPITEHMVTTYNIGEFDSFINHLKKCQFMKVKSPYGDD